MCPFTTSPLFYFAVPQTTDLRLTKITEISIVIPGEEKN